MMDKREKKRKIFDLINSINQLLKNFTSQWEFYQKRVNTILEKRLKSVGRHSSNFNLNQAMCYVCLNGGKRFRAFLVYACGKLAGASIDKLDTPACAVEMIHAYSLTHDDLPAMDNSDLRRGKPTCHIAFDEATAILAGDALQAEAFLMLADNTQDENYSSKIRMISELAKACGSIGMAGGQLLDLQAMNKTVDYDYLVNMYCLKTGALIRASAILGVLSADTIKEDFLNQLDKYAKAIGLAFQISDDILDNTEDNPTLGKPTGMDHKMHKSTYTSTLGIKKAKIEAIKLSNQAIETVRGLQYDTFILEQLAHFVVNRMH